MDIKSPCLLKLKGPLFLILGSIAAAILLLESPNLQTLALLLIVIWSFSRFYYFAFYVLHHYADPEFKYSGLLDLTRYLVGKRKNTRTR
ncbi:hypothetical protein [Roseibacillus persicicus]|uniref:Uncharacterized protein n=1 Tax=Roseibacillus persicicus TaxID=454148 RepID=A0A918WID8_9BACT|nr:hypothetical protein [Roseibacillus persicicus]GHC54317.1 hypothetical protein GCM10007100_20880 [Roseibacillus persicicus]